MASGQSGIPKQDDDALATSALEEAFPSADFGQPVSDLDDNGDGDISRGAALAEAGDMVRSDSIASRSIKVDSIVKRSAATADDAEGVAFRSVRPGGSSEYTQR